MSIYSYNLYVLATLITNRCKTSKNQYYNTSFLSKKILTLLNGKIKLQEFGANLRQKRKDRGLSLEALGHLAEMDNKHIAKVEKGQKDIRLSTVIKLIWALEVDPDELFPKK